MSVPAETHQPAQPLVRPLGPRRLLPLAIVVAGLIVFFVLGLNRELSLESLVRHHAAIEQMSPSIARLGFAAYVLLYITVVAFSIPALVLTVTGGVVFGTLLARLARSSVQQSAAPSFF